MKKIVVGLLFTISLCLVGCDYSVKNEEIYNEGLSYLKLEDVQEQSYSKKLDRAIKILDGNNEVEKFKNDEKGYNDFKYGILTNIVEDLNNKKELGVDDLLVKNDTSEIKLDELNNKQRDLYGNDYINIIDEYIALFSEILEGYNGEVIDKSYSEKLKEINSKYDELKKKITDQFADEMVNILMDQLPKQYTVKGTGTIKFK